jgi:hypothetical protein
MSQDAVFEFDDGHLEGDLGDLPDTILDGSLILGSRDLASRQRVWWVNPGSELSPSSSDKRPQQRLDLCASHKPR